MCFRESRIPEEEAEYDYSLDDPYVSGASDNPLDAIKSIENYSVQDDGTVSLDTKTGEIEG